MQANLAKREPEMLARWLAEDLYARVQTATAGRPRFWFIDGPPYANGDIHLGHAVNKTLKDMVVKAARLDGFDAAFVPGWDCHGLPIELQVEKKYGKVGVKLDARTFREKCREYAGQQVDKQREGFKRLGVLADWERPYLTMRPAYEAEQLRVLAQIIDNGHVVRGFKPVHWCLDCGSSLAEAEVEYQDKTSTAVDVRFDVVDAGDLAKRFGAEAEGAGLVIWTTTPWTLPANQAIAVNAELSYALVDFARAGRVVVAADMVDSIAKRWGDTAQVLATVKGAALEGVRARHPFAGRNVPVILGEHVTLDAGTGLVHTAPAHGAEDYAVSRQYQLPVDNPVASNGVFIDGTPLVAGTHVRKAEAPILEALTASGHLLHSAPITHSYPHCWRHKTPLIFRATPQWFVSMDQANLRQDALAAIAKTDWIPEWGEKRIHEMVAGRPDWCISRQRYWGVPLAVFTDRQTQALHPQSSALLRKIADAVEQGGLEAWFESQPADWGVDAAQFEACTDTLDVWFDSGVAHQCVFKSMLPAFLDEQATPPQADIYLEGSDQHRGWFQSSLLTSVAMRARAPYKQVLTHGFTVDEQGRKMSKSLGNGIEPQEIIKTLGADVLRLWVASSDYAAEITLSQTLLQRVAEAYRRIRNTARYLLGSFKDFDPRTDRVPPEQLVAIDAWAIAQASALQEELKAAYGAREFHQVYHKLHNYCVNDLGGLYLDVLKDRLYTLPKKSIARRSAQTALLHIGEGLVRWIAPILSFTADEIWQLLPGNRSEPVFAQRWHNFPAVSSAKIDWAALRALREGAKKVLEDLRVAGTIGSGLNARLNLYADGDSAVMLRKLGEELRFWFITSEVQVLDAKARPATAHAVVLSEAQTVWVAAQVCPNARCERCWHQRMDVGSDPGHPTLCDRCVDNIERDGERRQYF
ncbi:isoleucine--tRNA ligase [Sinimarinibacterium sp. NLF-5-8]|uniref:isoleucine--tRNA ligase n=1 Tax=Sinimarinibacterium sp. NLF-5-8 TaxID=2698684 RepID=UPI00345F2984